MNIIKSIQNLSKTECAIWFSSLALILLSFTLGKTNEYLTVVASLVGATALIFVGKGDALGQLLTMIFAVLYAMVSFQFRYYGEMFTYLGMTMPSAFAAMVSWLKHPYTEREVEVRGLTKKNVVFLGISAFLVTIGLGVVLERWGTANLWFSTISVTTSYLASVLTILRSPYYAVAYAANDIVLIVLWVLATIENTDYLPMILCFVIFLINDIYGYIRWQRMQKRQKRSEF